MLFFREDDIFPYESTNSGSIALHNGLQQILGYLAITIVSRFGYKQLTALFGWRIMYRFTK